MSRPEDPGDREATLDRLMSSVEARVQAYAAAHPDEPAEDWLYRELDAWAEQEAGPSDGLTVLDCRPGCDHCCQQGVMLTPLEAHFLAGAIRESWKLPEIEALESSLRAGWERLRRAGIESMHLPQQMAALSRIRRPCPLLDESSHLCRAYEARPLACRREHSTDVEVCRRHRLDPDAPIASARVARHELPWNAARRMLLTWMDADDPSQLYLPMELALGVALESS